MSVHGDLLLSGRNHTLKKKASPPFRLALPHFHYVRLRIIFASCVILWSRAFVLFEDIVVPLDFVKGVVVVLAIRQSEA